MTETAKWLPELLLLEDCDGIWEKFLETMYMIFKKDFIDSTPVFREENVRIIKKPMQQNKEATFWHIISTGKREEDRIPDMERCKRIRWPRALIDHMELNDVKCWPTTRTTKKRRNEKRYIIALADFSYVVILAQRKNYVLFWTAYYVERKHRRNKFRKEWSAHLENNRHRQ